MLRSVGYSIIAMGAALSRLVLPYFIHHSIFSQLALLCWDGHTSIPTCTLKSGLPILYIIQCPSLHLDAASLQWSALHHPCWRSTTLICALQLHCAPLYHLHCTPCFYRSTPHLALLFPVVSPLFHLNILYCVWTPSLMDSKLTSNYTLVRYHKSSQLTLAFNSIHLPSTKYQEIPGALPTALQYWWIVCSGFGLPWGDAK